MSADNFGELEALIDGLMTKIEPGKRSALAQRLGVQLRRGQADRIAAQRNPDGSAYAPRKRQEPLRGKVGRIKRKAKAGAMFRNLRKTGLMDVQATDQEVSVGFSQSTVARVGRVHHLGLRDRVSRRVGSPEFTSAERRLCGLSADDRARALEIVLDHLQG